MDNMETHPLNELPKLQEFLNNMPNGWYLCKNKIETRYCHQLLDFGYLQRMETPQFKEDLKTKYIIHYRKMQQSLF